MKKLLLITFISCFSSCKSDSYSFDSYFNKTEQDIILTKIITYIYQKAPNADQKTKFTETFKPFYQKQLVGFKVQNYFIDKDGINYFFLIRPVGNLPFKRGVLGKFKLTKELFPIQFEEIVNTPHLKEQVLKERGRFLFKELVKNKNLDKYLSLKHYVEWPDSKLIYDKSTNEWRNRN
jgi:hypothetical protein